MAKCRRCKIEMCDSSTKTCEAYQTVEFIDGIINPKILPD